MKLIKLLILTTFFFATYFSFGQSYSRIDLTGNPKAKGLSIAIKYPTGWEVKDGERPNIVKKFVHNYPDYIAMLMVQVKDIPKESIPEVKNFNLNDWKDILSEVGKVSNLKTLSLEGQKVFLGDVTHKMERLTASISQKQRVLGFIYKDKWVWLWCGAVAQSSMPESYLEKRFQDNSEVCFQFFNSLVLLDRY
jgi:hypothetical protein